MTDNDLSVFPEYKQYLLLEADYPLSCLYSIRNRLKSQTEDEAREPSMCLLGRTVVIDDVVVDLDGINGMFQQMLQEIEELERNITHGLSDSHPSLRPRVPTAFADKPNKHSTDFWFASMRENGLLDSGTAMLKLLVEHPDFHNVYFQTMGASGVRVHAANCHRFMRECARLRLLIWVAVHIGSGGPARGTEILSQTFRNAPRGSVRNLQIINGDLCIAGTYNKTDEQVSASPHPGAPLTDGDQTHSRKLIYRFPPKAIIRHLLFELAFLCPVQEVMARALHFDETAMTALRYKIFPGLYRELDSDGLTDALRAASFRHLGYEIGLRHWRKAQTTFCEIFGDYHPQIRSLAHYDQRGHSEVTGRTYSDIEGAPVKVPWTVMETQLGVSRCWQDLTGTSILTRRSVRLTQCPTGIEPLSPEERLTYGGGSTESILTSVLGLRKELAESRKANARLIAWIDAQDPAPAPPPPVLSPPPVGIVSQTVQPCKPFKLPDPSNLNLLRDFMNDPRASFTCPEQALGLELALNGKTNFFLIGPTGMGKSSVFLIPARLRAGKVTIVLIPLSGLRMDFAIRCKKLAIECTEWTVRDQEKSTIVMVSPENAILPPFLLWAKNLENSGLLNLIVYDEVHLLKTHASFRRCFEHPDGLVKIGGWWRFPPPSPTELTLTI